MTPLATSTRPSRLMVGSSTRCRTIAPLRRVRKLLSGAGVTADTTAMANRWVMLAVVFVARLSLGFQFQSIASVSPLLMSDLQLTYAQIGWLIGLFSLPGVVLAFPGGMLGRRFGERPVAVAGLALMVAGALITAWSATFLTASVGRALSGAGFVIANTVFAKMVADWFAGKELATAMAV